jgi:hypothetical protein
MDRRGIRFAWRLIVLWNAIMMITQIILLVMRLDYHSNIGYYHIAIPAWLASLATIIWGVVLTLFSHVADDDESILNGMAATLVAIGFAISQFLLASKFETSSDVMYLETLLPFIIFGMLAVLVSSASSICFNYDCMGRAVEPKAE